jgi:hypothetical protein
LSENNILISDACLVIDLIELKLWEKFLELDYYFITTSDVINEITALDQSKIISTYVETSILKINNSYSVDEIRSVIEVNTGLSYTDCSIIVLAKKIKGIVLSSDNFVTKTCSKFGLEHQGILWIINQLFQQKIISKEIALMYLTNYSDLHARVPIEGISILKESIQSLEINFNNIINQQL